MTSKPNKFQYDIFKEWLKLDKVEPILILSRMFGVFQGDVAHAIKRGIEWELQRPDLPLVEKVVRFRGK